MIQVNKALKRFDDFVALNGISLTVPQGSIYGMVGSNGAGKSTLMRLICGVYRLDGGEITVDGEPVWENIDAKKRIVFIPDELYAIGHASMDRMAGVYRSIYETFSAEVYEKLKGYFKLDGKKPLTTFSKGMRRQAMTILGLASQTEYLMFDETFDGLDPIMRNLVKNLICEDIMKRKATAMITSHSLRELEDTCDQLALLHKGGIVLQSEIGDLKTSLYKVQIAFHEPFDRTRFEGAGRILHYTQNGSVAVLIMRGDYDQTLAELKAMSPVILEAIPLTLEEAFTYEMEGLGYDFSQVLQGEETK